MRTLASRLAAALRASGQRALGIGQFGALALMPFGALVLTSTIGGDEAEAKTPGSKYCYYGTCHRVKTIAETEALIGTDETVSASFYDSCKNDRYNPCGLTSSGEEFRPDAADNVASPIYPDGTTLLVWSPLTQASLVVRVNNAGPYWGGRTLDVSRAAAEVLGFAGEGVATLKIRVLDAPDAAEATYKKGRTYDPLPGFIGRYASLESATAGMASAFAVAALASSLPSQAAPETIATAQADVTSAAGSAAVQLAAVVGGPAEQAKLVAVSHVLKPVQVASVVEAIDEGSPAVSRPVAAAVARTGETARSRTRLARNAERNSRSARVAARASRNGARGKAVVVASVREDLRPRPVTAEGTNDMSVFSRHEHIGVDRFVAQQPVRRPVYSSLTRDPRRDDRDRRYYRDDRDS